MKVDEKNTILEEHLARMRAVHDKLVGVGEAPCSKDMEPLLGETIRHRELVRKVAYSELMDTLYFGALFLVSMFATGLCAMIGIQNDNLLIECISLVQFLVGSVFMLVVDFSFTRFMKAGHVLAEGGKLLKEIDTLCKMGDFHKDPAGTIERLGPEGIEEMHRTMLDMTFRAMKEGKGVLRVVQNKEPEK